MPSAAAGAARSVAPAGPVVKPWAVGMPFDVAGVLVPEPVDIPLGALPIMAIPLPLLGFVVGVLLPVPLPLLLVPVVLPLLVLLAPEFDAAPLPLAGVPEVLPPPVADPLLPLLGLVPPVGVVPPPVVPPPQSPPPVVGALLHPARPVSTTAIANVDSAILPAGLRMGVRIMIRLRSIRTSVVALALVTP